MQSEAQRIHKILTDKPLSCFTLYGGYGMTYNFERVTFPTGSLRKEKRNKAGRMIYVECHYEDGSILVYRYNTGTETYTLTPMKGPDHG